MYKKIFLIVGSFVLVFAGLIGVLSLNDNQQNVYASTFNYTSTISDDVSDFGNYSVSDCDNIDFDTSSYFDFSGTIRDNWEADKLIFNTNIQSVTGNFQGITLYFLDNSFNLETLQIVIPQGKNFYFYDGRNLGFFNLAGVNVNYSLSFSSVAVGNTSLTSLFDMNSSETIFENVLPNNTLFNKIFAFLIGDNENNCLNFLGGTFDLEKIVVRYDIPGSVSSSTFYASDFGVDDLRVTFYSDDFGSDDLTLDYFSVSSYFFAGFFTDFVRCNSSLVFYNYDFSLLDYHNWSYYVLTKNNNSYKIDNNETIPNNRFIYFSNTEISNIIFDRYLIFYSMFLFNNENYNSLTFPFYFDNDLNSYCCKLGFDLNFTQYNQPFVANTGSFNIDFERPAYVDAGGFLDFNILAWLQNAFIFVMFYCPITSDLLKIVHLDEFIGGLMNVFAFEQGSISILGINIGGFLWVCIAFLIFFRLLQSFMPILWGSVKESYGDLTYNSRRYKSEQIKQKKETNYKKYLEKKKDNS